MKRSQHWLILIASLLLSSTTSAQLGGLKDRIFDYDAAGNRISRQQMTSGGGEGARPVLFTTPASADSLAVWPNPVEETLHLQLPENCIGVSMCDISGRTLFFSPTKVYTIDVSATPSGAYLIIAVLSDGTRQTQRVVVNR